jgi:ferredoxin-NADP reductase
MQTIRLYFGILRDSLKSFNKLFVIHHLTLQKVRTEGEDIKTFVFKSNKDLDYRAGQYGIWMLKRWVKGKPFRLFTVASPPDEGVIQLSTRISKSDFKQKLNKLVPGDKLLMFGPIGEFTIPKQPPGDIVFVAGGIGITPIRAIAKHIRDASLPIKSILIHSSHDLYLYKAELEQYIDQTYFTTHDNFETTLDKVAKQQQNATYYLSGPPQFVESARKLLMQNNIRLIKTDGFLGY